MKKRALKRKRIRLLLSCILVMGLAIGAGYGLKVRASDNQTVKKDTTNTGLGTSDMSVTWDDNEYLKKKYKGNNRPNQHFFRSYVYLGKETPIKFQVINSVWATDDDLETNLQVKNALLLDCMSVLGTSVYENQGTTVIDKLNGSHFYTNSLTDTEKNAILKRTISGTNKTETISLPWDWLMSIRDNELIKALAQKDEAYWIRGYEYYGDGKIKGEKNPIGYVDTDGSYKSVSDAALKTTKSGISPSFLLDKSKILFSTYVEADIHEKGKEEKQLKVNNNEYWLYTNGSYKLTLIDDKLEAKVADGKSVTMDSDNTISVPYTITDNTGDSRDDVVSLLVTNGERDKAGSSIVSYQYQSVETTSGTANFTWDQNWNDNYYNGTYHAYLIAEKQSNDYSTDAASKPVELTITKKLSSVDVTFYAPMRDSTNWKSYADSMTIGNLLDNSDYKKFEITGFNGKSISELGSDDELKNLLKFDGFYCKDLSQKADFNTKYTMALGLKIDNDTMDKKVNKYSFADKVTINLKIVTSDDQTESKVEPIVVNVKNDGTVTVYDDTKEVKQNNTTDKIYFNFDFKTRKAKILSIVSPLQSDSPKEVAYASKFDGIAKQLDSEATVVVESITGDPSSESGSEEGSTKYIYKETEVKVPVTWGGTNNDEFEQGSYEFVAWGDLASPKGKDYDINKQNAYVSVKMGEKQTLSAPVFFLNDNKDVIDSSTDAPGESANIKLKVWNGEKEDTEASIYYTLDGDDPTTESEKYDPKTGIELSEGTYEKLQSDDEVTITLKAMAIRDDWNDSGVSTVTITFTKKYEVTATDATIKDRTEETPVEGQDENTHIYKIRLGTTITLDPVDKGSEGKVFSRWNIGGVKQSLKDNQYTTDSKDADKGTSTIKIKSVYKALDAPTITTGPEDKTVIDAKEGETATFSVNVTSPSEEYQDSLSYQWQKKKVGDADFVDLKDSEGTVTPDEDNCGSTLKIENIDYSQNGDQYRCVVTYTEIDGKTTKTATLQEGVTDTATLTVQKNGGKVSITSDPTDVTIKEGNQATFTVSAEPGYEGDLLTYQWQMAEKDSKEFTNIEGATDATYTVENATEEGQNGTQYRCIVTEVDADGNAIDWGKDTGDGSKTSKAATLTVTKEILYKVTVEGGTLEDGSTSGSFMAGTTVTINAAVVEDQRFVGWTCDNDQVKLKDKTSETTSFEMPKFEKEDTEFTITANYKPAYGITITKEPENAAVAEGKPAEFSVEATTTSDEYTMLYEWQANYHNDKGWQTVQNARENGTSYTVKKATKELSGSTFRCVITLKEDSKTTVTTQEVVLNVDGEDYTVTVNGGTATPESCKAGDTVTIKADDAEEGKVFKQWKVVEGSVNLGDTTSAETSFIMPDSDVELTAEYKEENPIQITTQPESVSTPEGGSVTFTVAATSSHELRYQWQEDKGDGKGFQNVGNEESYTISSVASSLNGARYQCVISAADDEELTVTSSEAVLTVTASTYTIKVNNGTGSATESVAGEVITVTANDAPEGQEFEKWVVVKGKANLADVSSKETTFTMPAANVELDVKYRNQIGAPTISKQPESVTVFAGSSTNFTVEATGDELSYQWQVDKGDGSEYQDISGATTATYRVYTEDCSMNGYKYQCVVSNRAGSVTSDAVALTVTYKITQGAGASWQKNSNNGLTFKGSGAYDKFQSVKVDGERLSGSNYTKNADPTVINLSATYLQTLTNGTHTITIVWEDGTAEAEFSIGGTATSSSSATASSSGSRKNNTSSGTTGSTSDQEKTTGTDETKETGTTDMPIVNKSKSSSDDGTGTTKSTTNSNKGSSRSAKIIGEGTSSGSSLLNRYAAIISLMVVGGCGIGGAATFVIRRIIRRKDEDEMF